VERKEKCAEKKSMRGNLLAFLRVIFIYTITKEMRKREDILGILVIRISLSCAFPTVITVSNLQALS
jgi:hypothetical protein